MSDMLTLGNVDNTKFDAKGAHVLTSSALFAPGVGDIAMDVSRIEALIVNDLMEVRTELEDYLGPKERAKVLSTMKPLGLTEDVAWQNEKSFQGFLLPIIPGGACRFQWLQFVGSCSSTLRPQ